MKKRMMIAGLALSLGMSVATPAPAQDDFARQRAEWNMPTEPFRIVGNVHYVGTAQIAAYLITGPDGHILVDGAMEESADQIVANIARLGFRVEDIDFILLNHAHWDHAGGLAELKRRSGANIVVGAADAADLQLGRNMHRGDVGDFPPVVAGRPVRDGEHLRLGPIEIIAHSTPGHTPGCTSWTTRVREGDRDLNILFACSLTVAGQPLVGDPGYPQAAADFERSFAKLRELRADVFLGFHTGQFGFADKRRRQLAGEADAFVDPAELNDQVERAEAAFRVELERQRAASTTR